MEKERERVAKQIDTAFQNAGFVYLTGHGVSADMVREAFTWSKTFFALPPATKMLAPHPPGGTHHRGYSSPGLEKVSQHTYSDVEIEKERQVPDYKESFESGNVNDIAQPNIWLPEQELPGFRPFMEEYFTVCAGLVHRVLHALSLALDVPAPGLGSTHAESLFQLRLLHYPAMPAEELRDHTRARINAHSDFGTLTLLFQDAVGGLEIEDPHAPGVFRAVPPVEDAVLVNVGDLLARWSNDRWRSSVHRVGLPGEGGGEMVPERYSIPFFATADMDTVIDALPGCWDEADPESKKYEPVTAWGYVQMRMAALYEG
ncbi:Clavaminate synthase-like protein [Dothidotthia symphoricarpi CBS 119687]|uniref:Clavaminate synthase-like protein n=1 Tax=Dothidotthia symphoricarpi CBS 119687 TaxID=1392245 RepID=A0A6A6AGH9_9PLEO|nr:Clavaminate synthase-like protein [Dothidotthia symphoricarpi CBS 119687]KAF2130158.1 Clavaminate synthase-like protein [Dothidotthia symphoricarpi CBS 119687]